jgi:hypothetical protein
MTNILILGGYGNFGKRISEALAKSKVPIIISGRDAGKAKELCCAIENKYKGCRVSHSIFDAKTDLVRKIKELAPIVIINTVGPFQNCGYDIAKACISCGVHYIDIADARDFVVKISELDKKAVAANVSVISGASTVPCLSSAVLEEYKNNFSKINSIVYGISPGQKAERGLATTAGILSYIGKQLKPIPFVTQGKRYGWQDIYIQKYPELGRRWMANCDIPDFDLFPKRYGINKIKFSAGMENSILHLGIWLMSWLVRFGLPIQLSRYAKCLLKLSYLFDAFGTADGGMHMIIQGIDHHEKYQERKWFIIAKNSHGPYIPTIPAIILAKKLFYGLIRCIGAQPCIGLISLKEYLQELKEFNIKTYTWIKR